MVGLDLVLDVRDSLFCGSIIRGITVKSSLNTKGLSVCPSVFQKENSSLSTHRKHPPHDKSSHKDIYKKKKNETGRGMERASKDNRPE